MQLVKNAMAWPFVQDGVPILYYGKSQYFTRVSWLTVLQVRSKATRAVLTLPTVRRTYTISGLGVCVLI